jgi:geranylgeranyl pyrophosphate synthase
MPSKNNSARDYFHSPANFLKHTVIQKRLERINSAIQQEILAESAEPKILYEAAYHLINAGGKRLRSLLVLLCCEAVRGRCENALPICVATELFQTASLIQDDIIDQDTIRRGVSTVHMKYGTEIAILAAGLLIAKAYYLFGKFGNPKLVRTLSLAIHRMSEGEVAELLINPKNPQSFSKNNYLSIIRRKTAASFELAVKIGAILGKASQKQKKAISKYGFKLGMAFQIRDDVLDITMMNGQSSKASLSDLHLKRANYAIIHALQECPINERIQFLNALEKGKIKTLVSFLEKTSAVENAMQLAESYSFQAKQALQGLKFANQKILEQLAAFVLIREF